MAEEDDKTVFGQAPLPQPPRPAGAPPSAASERTVFGQPLPPAAGGPGRMDPGAPSQPQPPPAADPWRMAAAEDTWLGGALSPQPAPGPLPPQSAPAGQYGPQAGWPQPGQALPGNPAYPVYPGPASQGYPAHPGQAAQGYPAYPGQAAQGYPGYPADAAPGYPPYPGQPALQPLYRPGTGQRPAGAEFFPEIPRDAPPVEPARVPRIALADALRAAGLGAGGSSNPLVAAAANLMILLGRLRTGLVEMQPAPLIQHVTREIDLFERNALAAGIGPQDANDAKYALSATADDIVQNLPGADRGMWMEYAMVARFFGERSSGVGFFQKMDEAMRAPAQRFNLLELMLACLSLGFEGQYRTLPNGAVELARIRIAIYETLRRVHPRPDDDISVKWAAVPMNVRRRRGGVPLWIVAAMAALTVVSLFATLSTLLGRQGGDVRDGILALHQGLPPIAIERTEPVLQPYVAPSSQLDRMRASLAEEIAAGTVEVERNNEWVFVRVGEALQFAPASADLRADFAMLAGAIARTLDAEEGPIRVVGHTDSDRMSGRGLYKTNEELSLARAQTVAEILSGIVAAPARIAVEGMGATDPIADNATPEGKARNRRVEIMIPRKD